MVRVIIGVIAGLVVSFVLMFICFSLVYAVMGAEGAFRPGSYAVSGGWTAASFAVFAIAGIAGGALCSKIAPTPGASRMLAVVFVALMLVASIKSFTDSPASRPGGVAMMTAMQNAYTPPAAVIVNALVGGAGIVAGGFVARRKR